MNPTPSVLGLSQWKVDSFGRILTRDGHSTGIRFDPFDPTCDRGAAADLVAQANRAFVLLPHAVGLAQAVQVLRDGDPAGFARMEKLASEFITLCRIDPSLPRGRETDSH